MIMFEKAGEQLVPKQEKLLELADAILQRCIELPNEAKKNETLQCPHCQSRRFVGVGKQSGTQRFKCKVCSKYFSETTGKVTYCLKKRERFSRYLQCILLGYSIRKSAVICSISKHTSFVWRHKILIALQNQGDPKFGTILEGLSVEEAYSEKGKRKRASLLKEGKRSPQEEVQIAVSESKVAELKLLNHKEKPIPVGLLVLRDREGNTAMKVVRSGKVCKKDLDRLLSDKTKDVHVICSPSNRSFTAFYRGKDIVHKKSKFPKLKKESLEGVLTEWRSGKRGVRKAEAGYQINNVLEYVVFWKRFMRRFHGVATKYLQNYLNWYILLDKLKTNTLPLVSVENYLWKADGAWYLYKTGIFNTDFST
jgi:transposase-like protein